MRVAPPNALRLVVEAGKDLVDSPLDGRGARPIHITECINEVPEAQRAKVSLIALLGFAPDADFQIRVGGWLGMPASDKALMVQPELTRVPPAMVQCFYGADEKDTLCPALTNTGIDVIRTGGDHHFGGDYNALEQRILVAFKKQSGAHD